MAFLDDLLNQYQGSAPAGDPTVQAALPPPPDPLAPPSIPDPGAFHQHLSQVAQRVGQQTQAATAPGAVALQSPPPPAPPPVTTPYQTDTMLSPTMQMANTMADSIAGSQGAAPGNGFAGVSGSNSIVRAAATQIGSPYVWAAENPQGGAGGPGTGFDCSGLTSWAVHRATGVSLPHNASEQMHVLPSISRKQLQPGDLIFYCYGRLGSHTADHVAIYAGGNKQIAASSGAGHVTRQGIDWSHVLGYGAVKGGKH